LVSSLVSGLVSSRSTLLMPVFQPFGLMRYCSATKFTPLVPFVICWLGFQTAADIMITGEFSSMSLLLSLLNSPSHSFMGTLEVAYWLPKDRYHHQPTYPWCDPNGSLRFHLRSRRFVQFRPSPRDVPLRHVCLSYWSYLHQRASALISH